MTRLVYDDAVNDDVRRITAHLLEHDAAQIEQRVADIFDALWLLTEHPLIGRPVADDRRDLVIGRDARGYVARYRFDPIEDVVHVLALRSQRESGFVDR